MNSYLKVFSKKSGFTLIELLVSITIVSLVVSLSITAYPKFSDQIAVVAETYKIVAYSRESQVFGISAYVDPGTKIAYAMAIETGNNTISRYVITNPTDSTNQYYIDNFTVDATSKTLNIKDNFTISKICYDDACTSPLSKVYVVFRRPNPEARLIGVNGNVISPDTAKGSYGKIKITLQSKNNPSLTKNVDILQTGQMYVEE